MAKPSLMRLRRFESRGNAPRTHTQRHERLLRELRIGHDVKGRCRRLLSGDGLLHRRSLLFRRIRGRRDGSGIDRSGRRGAWAAALVYVQYVSLLARTVASGAPEALTPALTERIVPAGDNIANRYALCSHREESLASAKTTSPGEAARLLMVPAGDRMDQALWIMTP